MHASTMRTIKAGAGRIEVNQPIRLHPAGSTLHGLVQPRRLPAALELIRVNRHAPLPTPDRPFNCRQRLSFLCQRTRLVFSVLAGCPHHNVILAPPQSHISNPLVDEIGQTQCLLLLIWCTLSARSQTQWAQAIDSLVQSSLSPALLLWPHVLYHCFRYGCS